MNHQVVTQKLKDLGWNWTHPRINAYISDLSRIRKTNFTPQYLPPKHYQKLQKILECYERIALHLVGNASNWNDPIVVDFFFKHSRKDKFGNPTNRLKLEQWLELEEVAIDEIICPF